MITTNIAAVDLETSCGVQSCPGFGLSNSSKCKHAVHHKLNKIDIIGVYDGKNYHLFREVREFDAWKTTHKARFIGHGIKFDFKTLKAKGSNILPKDVVGDTQYLGSAVKNKVPPQYIKTYNLKRNELNALLPPKQRHREGKPLSLKVMAPFYLGVEPFWENPQDHNDEEYNKLDCIYTYKLHHHLSDVASRDGTLQFYNDYLIPWSKLLTEAEFEGILIDEKKLYEMYGNAIKETKRLEDEVHKVAREAFIGYRSSLEQELVKESKKACDRFIVTRIKDFDKVDGVLLRYSKSLTTKVSALPDRFNLQSPKQMNALLAFHGIDMTVEKRDKETNEWIEKEGTDKYVLKRAKIRQKSTLAEKLLAYRNKETEVSYLKQYIESCVGGRIYCTFNITGTRTGRLSSAGPNLQNVKGSLRSPFVVADTYGYTIYTVDASQIEPRLVAYLTQDEEMVKLFVDGRDYHNYATKKFFPTETMGVEESEVKQTHAHLRKTAKIGDLSIIYGTGAFTFQTMCLVREEMDIPIKECKEMVSSFREGMRGVFGWKKNLEEQYKAGHPVQDLFGGLVQARDYGSVHMTLFNSYVQGLASRMIFHGSLLAFRHFAKNKIDAKPLLWVHDEVVWRFPKGKEKFCKATVDYYMKDYKLDTKHGRVPLDVEGHLSNEGWIK